MAQIKKTKVEDKEVAIVQTEISPIITKAKAIVVKDAKSMEAASLMLSEVNKHLDRIEDEKQKVLKPLNEARTAEINRWKPVISTLTTAIEHLRGTISAFQTAEVKRVRAEGDAIANRVGEGKGKLKVETAAKKMSEIAKPEEIVSTEAGMVTFREKQVVKIVDANLIPREYVTINETKVLEALKAGIAVPGAELDIKLIPYNSR